MASPENSVPEENKSEASFVARLAAELATPNSSQDEAEKPAEPISASPGQAESVISPERMAMRQLQGRLRKNLLLKRPSPASDESEEAPELCLPKRLHRQSKHRQK